MTSATPKSRAGEHVGPIRYVRAPEYDRRIKNSDDFAGDAYVRWVAVGHTPDQPEALEAERDSLRERERELVEALRKIAGCQSFADGDVVDVARIALAKHGR